MEDTVVNAYLKFSKLLEEYSNLSDEEKEIYWSNEEVKGDGVK